MIRWICGYDRWKCMEKLHWVTPRHKVRRRDRNCKPLIFEHSCLFICFRNEFYRNLRRTHDVSTLLSDWLEGVGEPRLPVGPAPVGSHVLDNFCCADVLETSVHFNITISGALVIKIAWRSFRPTFCTILQNRLARCRILKLQKYKLPKPYAISFRS